MVRMKKDYLEMMRRGDALSLPQLLTMIVRLSIPTMLAQVSFIIMEYVDASMVGRLGANATAAIGLVASSTWLFGGLLNCSTIGFSVQSSQYLGAGDEVSARRILRQGLVGTALFSTLLLVIGAAIHRFLPVWLGGEAAIVHDAGMYFLIFALSLPFNQFNNFAAGMLQSTGNMRTPGLLDVLLCALNVGFNYVFIYLCHLGVAGAALGTALSEVVIAVPMGVALLVKSPMLHLRKSERLVWNRAELKRAFRIALPVGFEQVVMCSAQVMQTAIVAPLGSVAIAANSLAVTAEALCYMPGYGIAAAATAMIGQSIGAKRADLTRRLSWVITLFGMAIMGVGGAAMYFAAPVMMRLLTPVAEIVVLGAAMLKIEAFAEPLFGASIVATGVFRGAGDTLVPSVMNLISMWAVRIPLAAVMAPRIGLKGVWIAMCTELCFRGIIFLIRLYQKQGKEQKRERI